MKTKAIDYGVYVQMDDGARHCMSAILVDPATTANVEKMFKAMVDLAGNDLRARLGILEQKDAFVVSVILQLTLSELSKQLSEEGISFKADLNS